MRDDLGCTPDVGMGTALLTGFGAVVLVAAAVTMWSAWNGFHLVDKSVPGTTIGASTSGPAARPMD
jgi:hypothetical protein